jgi:hypothetical protein
MLKRRCRAWELLAIELLSRKELVSAQFRKRRLAWQNYEVDVPTVVERNTPLKKNIFISVSCLVISRKLRRQLAGLVKAHDFITGWNRRQRHDSA